MKQLRPYQQSAIESVFLALKRGISKSIISIPTGGGKTFVAVKLSEIGEFKRVLFCCDAEELCEQSALAFLREKFDSSLTDYIEKIGFIEYIRKGGICAGSDYKVGLIKADVFQPHGNVVIASLQTLWRKLDQIDPNEFDLVIIDECHIAGSKTVMQCCKHFTPRLLLGISATPFRMDNVSLGSVFDEIVYEYNIQDAIKDKYLCEIDAVRVKTNINIDSVHTLGGEFNQKELADEVNTLVRNNLVADSYLKYAKGRQMIGYTVDVQHAVDLAEACVAKGIKATAISSKEAITGNRSQQVKDFKAGKYDLVFNCGVLVKGFDFPNLGGVIHACPTKSLVKWKQATGRCLRLKDESYVNKFGQQALLIDIVDTTSRHNLINSYTLDKGLNPEERVYITSENREKLIEARRIRIEGKHNKDERVQLLPILSPRFKTTIKSQELATQPQLDWLRALGYPVDEVAYTKENCREILGSLPAKKSDLEELRKLGYDTQQPITRNQASYTIWKHKNKQIKWNK